MGEIARQNTINSIVAAANKAASDHVFKDYRERKSKRTLARQSSELANLVLFLQSINEQAEKLGSDERIPIGWFTTDPKAWVPIEYGIVKAFIKWLKNEGFALSTINLHLSTIKAYTKLAMQAGAIGHEHYTRVQVIQGYGHTEGIRVDATRNQTRHRSSTKKSRNNIAPREVIDKMKVPVDGTFQAVRDALLMSILFDHGFRVGEVALLQIEMIDRDEETITFYRPKVSKEQTHRLSTDTMVLLNRYLSFGVHRVGPLFISTRKSKTQDHIGMSTQAIIQRVRFLGKHYGIDNLSPHDCRHTWATYSAMAGTPVDALQYAGGWNSPAMPLRYIEAARIANERVILGNAPIKKKRK